MSPSGWRDKTAAPANNAGYVIMPAAASAGLGGPKDRRPGWAGNRRPPRPVNTVAVWYQYC